MVPANFSGRTEKQMPLAILIDASGEQLQKYFLPEEQNEFSIDGIAPDLYSAFGGVE